MNILKLFTVKDLLTIIFGIASLIYAIICTIKARNKAKESKEEFNFYETLYETVLQSMECSEKTLTPLKNFVGQTVSEMKLDDTLKRVQNFCLTHGKIYNEEKVKTIINKLIDFSKIVNYKK